MKAGSTGSGPSSGSKAPEPGLGEEDIKVLSALSFAVAILVVGVPVWWRTTEVVRFPLPNDSIEGLVLEGHLKFRADVEVVVRTLEHSSVLDLDALDKCLKSELFVFNVKKRLATEFEADSIGTHSRLEDLDAEFGEKLSAEGARRSYGLVLVEIDGSKYGLEDSREEAVAVGNGRIAYFSSGTPMCKVAEALKVLSGEPFVNAVLNKGKLMSKTALASASDSPAAQGIPDPLTSKWYHRKSALSPEYEILLSLILPEPREEQISWWGPATPMEALMVSVAKELEDIFKLSLKTQVLYYTSLNLPQNLRDVNVSSGPFSEPGGRLVRVVGEADLGVAIGMESKLVSHFSSVPTLNFLAYVPADHEDPLLIKPTSPKDPDTLIDSFLVPRWGGVSIVNSMEAKGEQEARAATRFLSSVITQMRLLLGLPDSSEMSELRILQRPSAAAVSLWERDLLLRLKFTEYMASTKTALQSLAKLLSQISTIVINEEVASQIHSAVRDYEAAVASCFESGSRAGSEAGGEPVTLEECFRLARSSFMSAEKAFFDNSLLALLYFPEDQKYAIYVPMFLPVIVSFLACLKVIVARMKLLASAYSSR